jgi:hypothetical protein
LESANAAGTMVITMHSTSMNARKRDSLFFIQVSPLFIFLHRINFDAFNKTIPLLPY